MDTDELRRAFTLSESIYEQIRAFRRDRVGQLMRDETPVPLMAGGKLVLHLVPVASFRSRQLFDVATMPQLTTQFPPMATAGWSSRLNLDGHVSYNSAGHGQPSRSYTQFFRNGCVEAVRSDVVKQDEHEGKLLLAGNYEHMLTQRYQFFKQLLTGLQQVGVQPPVWCFLTIIGVKGARIPMEGHFPDENVEIDRDILELPERLIDDLAADATQILRPLFDLVWNAAGFVGSRNFDANGKWIGH